MVLWRDPAQITTVIDHDSLDALLIERGVITKVLGWSDRSAASFDSALDALSTVEAEAKKFHDVGGEVCGANICAELYTLADERTRRLEALHRMMALHMMRGPAILGAAGRVSNVTIASWMVELGLVPVGETLLLDPQPEAVELDEWLRFSCRKGPDDMEDSEDESDETDDEEPADIPSTDSITFDYSLQARTISDYCDGRGLSLSPSRSLTFNKTSGLTAGSNRGFGQLRDKQIVAACMNRLLDGPADQAWLEEQGIDFDFLSVNDGGFVDRRSRPYKAIVQIERNTRRLVNARASYQLTLQESAYNSDYAFFLPAFDERVMHNWAHGIDDISWGASTPQSTKQKSPSSPSLAPVESFIVSL